MEKTMREILLSRGETVKIVFSDPSDKASPKKTSIRRLSISDPAVSWQAEELRGAQAFHRNLSDAGYEELVTELCTGRAYRQINMFFADRAVNFRVSRKGKVSRSVDKNRVTELSAGHNDKKQYFINEGDDVPVMQELGIFTAEGRIVRSMYDKFRQINRFIEILDDCFASYSGDEISVLDFGCGKSYLTFLVYHYFKNIKGINVRITGYDLKDSVVRDCSALAEKYGYEGLKFVVADVTKDVLSHEKIDVVISLHACDTATDYALGYAISRGVPYIFSVPCCQHEVNSAIRKGGEFDILLSHGIFKERLSALLTDSFRAEILSAMGYKVDVLEFVDLAHSPKNLMLRARRGGKKAPEKLSGLLETEKRYGFRQTLLHLVLKGERENDC